MNNPTLKGALTALALSLGIPHAYAAETKRVDVMLLGGGIMSSTLAVWLSELEPGWSMEMVERLDKVAEESSNGWNNAGTGHSALAELNYTPEKDGKIDITKAVEINEAFQITRQFRAWQVKTGVLHNPRSFINSMPHMSFVWGDDNIRFLKKRYEALQASPLFRPMQYSEDPTQIKQWVPLMMEGRDPSQKSPRPGRPSALTSTSARSPGNSSATCKPARTPPSGCRRKCATAS
ncbi:malate:quinone-oxidoreductase [Pseudomonas synxantha]|nr:malate:quinone-oxidoreductase [Pseudomonas synxantha]